MKPYLANYDSTAHVPMVGLALPEGHLPVYLDPKLTPSPARCQSVETNSATNRAGWSSGNNSSSVGGKHPHLLSAHRSKQASQYLGNALKCRLARTYTWTHTRNANSRLVRQASVWRTFVAEPKRPITDMTEDIDN